jgi:hypothetical protein
MAVLKVTSSDTSLAMIRQHTHGRADLRSSALIGQ